MWFRRKPGPDPAEAARALREQALAVTADQVGAAPTSSRTLVWGVMMETGYAEAVASLVAFADGTTSLYFSNGGGIIGAGAHDSVRAAAEAFLDEAEAHVEKFSPAAGHPLPARGRVRFYVHTFSGLLSADADEQDLGYERHALSPVFHAGHAVISEVRAIDEARR